MKKMLIAGIVTTTTIFSLTPFCQNIIEIISTVSSHIIGQHSNLARSKTYASRPSRPALCYQRRMPRDPRLAVKDVCLASHSRPGLCDHRRMARDPRSAIKDGCACGKSVVCVSSYARSRCALPVAIANSDLRSLMSLM